MSDRALTSSSLFQEKAIYEKEMDQNEKSYRIVYNSEEHYGKKPRWPELLFNTHEKSWVW